MGRDPVQMQVVAGLRRLGLVADDEMPPMQPLAGGVSSEVFRVALRTGPVCVKRALPQLKVEQEWHVPVERNAFEVLWLRAMQRIAPRSVPAVLGEDRIAGLFVMTYLNRSARIGSRCSSSMKATPWRSRVRWPTPPCCCTCWSP